MQPSLHDPTVAFLVLAALLVVVGAALRRRPRRPRSYLPKASGGRRMSDDPVLKATVPVRRVAGIGRPAAPVANDDPLAAFDGCTVRYRARLMGREQGRVYAALLDWAAPRGLRVSTEVSLAALFTVTHAQKAEQWRAWGKIKQKYLDFLVLDETCRPLCGVEYHGTGHFQGDAAARDAVKRRAFALAGLPLVEVGPDTAPGAVAEAVARALGEEAPSLAAE